MPQAIEQLSVPELTALANREADKLRPDRQRLARILGRMCQLAPQDISVWSAAGWCWEMVGAYDKAIFCYLSCQVLGSTSMDAAIARVRAVQRGGENGRAE